MYLPVALGCNHPNSATPMTAARIAAQNARVSRKGRAFTSGNAVLDGVMAKLTPPVPRPSAGDLQNSRGIYNASPFPEPGGGPAPTVELRTVPQMLDWYSQWAASSAAAAANANWGALVMPTVGGPSPGVSTAVPPAGGSGSSGSSGSGASRLFAQGVGVRAKCAAPKVLPLETVGRGDAAGGRSSQPGALNPGEGGVSPWTWAALVLGGLVLYQAASEG